MRVGMRTSLEEPLRHPRSRTPHTVAALAAGALAVINTTAVLPATPAAADTPSALHGTVTMPDGSPAAGAKVTVSLMPPDATTSSGIEPILATTTTANDGAFSVSVPVTTEVSTAVIENGGIANLEIDAEDVAAAVQGYIGTNTDLTLYEDNEALAIAADTTNGTLDLAQPVELQLDDVGSAGTYDTANPTDPTGPMSPTPGPYWCNDSGWYVVYGPTAGETKIGEIHSYRDTRSVRWAYTTSANTTIDVGYSYDGGAYSVSGGTHIGNKNGVENGGVHAGSYYGHNIVAHFNYVREEDKQSCTGGKTHVTHRVRATVWNGDEYAGTDMSWEDGYNTWKEHYDAGGADIARFTAGQNFGRTTNKTTKYLNAITILGATLGSQTTMDVHHYQGWKFGSDPSHDLIGDNGPPSTAGTIWAY